MGWTFARKWGSQGTGNGQFSWFCDLCVYGDQVFVVEDDNNRVQAFGLDGTFRYKWGAAGVGNGQFDQPTGIAASGNEIYVVDALNSRIQVFNLVGVYQRQWGSAGAGDGQFSFVDDTGVGLSRLAVSDGLVYVGDTGNNRVQVFTTAGAFQRKWTVTQPCGLSVYGGEVYVLTRDTAILKVYSPTGVLQRSLVGAAAIDSPNGLCVGSAGAFVASSTSDVVMAFNATTGGTLATIGGAGVGDGQFTAPTGVFLYGGELYAYSLNRVQVFAYVTAPPLFGAYYDGLFTGGYPL